jgi:hypothetical protein
MVDILRVSYERRMAPSITNFKPQAAWKSIRHWLEAMQIIPAA